ncbi:MAG: hypothetical protein PHO85_03025 [Candidatus Cloacimonetes bacterium]|nr:hypothetical protein [Candidatus Cloacimonadota bacterium]MDD2506182.1 hypothetical protein [Candidatus Cloacimonadota bacterium]MDD4147476.1 hypothetical protein [Candidatus Cloacimonadota bacterium]MDD4559352.1 hypothetical protein [Candidatus Cloacimonadota bacterium]
MTEQKSRSRVKYYIVAALIVVIVALILVVPRWKAYQTQKRAGEVREAVEALHSYVDSFWQSHGSAGGFDLDSALVEIGLKNKVIENWDFAIAWKSSDIYTTQMVEKLKNVNENELVFVAPYKIIMAVATTKNPVGEGRKLWFDGDNNSYHGFGADDKIEPDWNRIFPNP